MLGFDTASLLWQDTRRGMIKGEGCRMFHQPALCSLTELLALLLTKLLGDVVVDALAGGGGELLGTGDDAVPLLLGEPALDVLARDTIFHHTIDESGIEVVACAHRADRRRLDGRIALAETVVGTQLHGAGTLSVDELLTIERDLTVVDLVGIGELVEHFKVLMTAAHDVGLLEIFEIIGRDLHHLVAV